MPHNSQQEPTLARGTSRRAFTRLSCKSRWADHNIGE